MRAHELIIRKAWNWLDEKTIFFFPHINIYSQIIPFSKTLLLFILFTLIFSAIGLLFPADGFIGFDWVHFFQNNNLPAYYPPWAELVTDCLSWPLLIGLTLAGMAVAILLRTRQRICAALPFFSLPLFWTLFLGQIDGLALIGIHGLPWLIPLVMMKPQIAIFSVLARRSFLLFAIGFFIMSILIWGLWPLTMFSIWTIHAEGTYPNDIALGIFGLPIAIILGWFSRGDMDMLMAAGAFAAPYLLPYNLLVVVPAIARMRPIAALIAVLFSWLPFSANWIGERGWYLGWVFVAWIWLQLARERYLEKAFKN